jgi:hypothetical protein
MCSGHCCDHARRDALREREGAVGLDYVEVTSDPLVLEAFFLGDIPAELRENPPERHLRIEGGDRITGIAIVDADPVLDDDAGDRVRLRVDRAGDFSRYTLRLLDVDGLDPRLDRATFVFHIDCPLDAACPAACECGCDDGPEPPEPRIDYLAKDYASFRRAILDRLSLLVPGWTERSVPDIGITLVELLAYTGDYLSYYQDAVATEAYLDTARRRISVRRHARLVDYVLHEGCNARTWVCAQVGEDVELDGATVAFVTALNESQARPGVLSWTELEDIPDGAYEVFEPVGRGPLALLAAHNEIRFHTWGDRQCTLARGATAATLVDAGLALDPGDVLIFEEVIGPETGLVEDADPARRHGVRLTEVRRGEDALVGPTPVLEVRWDEADALPFSFCLSGIGPAPECRELRDITVARGNAILVDHGRTRPERELGNVPALRTTQTCECAGHPTDADIEPGVLVAELSPAPVVYGEPLAAGAPAARLLVQDPRAALPHATLQAAGRMWAPRLDLLESGPGDAHFVVEVDDQGLPHLRFGDGELGEQPAAGLAFTETHRTGGGTRGNVGAEAIARLVLDRASLDGTSVVVRNPLAARGGVDPEPIAVAKLMAPRAFRAKLERAIVAADYERLAERDPRVQGAAAVLAWTGSWYEAVVGIDPLGREEADAVLTAEIEAALEPCRRMGHDLRVRPAEYVAIDLALEVCVCRDRPADEARTALLELLREKLFAPDGLKLGESIYVSRIVAAAMRVPGVSDAAVTRLQRRFQAPNHELRDGLLALRPWEVARLDDDPDHPERGRLELTVRGGH